MRSNEDTTQPKIKINKINKFIKNKNKKTIMLSERSQRQKVTYDSIYVKYCGLVVSGGWEWEEWGETA